MGLGSRGGTLGSSTQNFGFEEGDEGQGTEAAVRFWAWGP